jgi:hypothetical protein
MSNAMFVRWTRSVAFNLTLTEDAIHHLISMEVLHNDAVQHGKDPNDYPTRFYARGVAGYLAKRGLIQGSNCNHGFCLTEAGRLTAQLLREAGFKHQGHDGSIFTNHTEIHKQQEEACKN